MWSSPVRLHSGNGMNGCAERPQPTRIGTRAISQLPDRMGLTQAELNLLQAARDRVYGNKCGVL